ncbi:hypothetical protein E2C01_079155 [Portunus trituberculatus]|uniref:Uncharacterized protein n=1 Tax=Portunus trituberculatus TaxID=210409 RepID=A0A5B7ISJ3_PORTR|nr:hypothetical protein [Portunus trituberculatus]
MECARLVEGEGEGEGEGGEERQGVGEAVKEEKEEDKERNTESKERVRKESKFCYHTFGAGMDQFHLPMRHQENEAARGSTENESPREDLRSNFGNLEARASIKRLEFKHTRKNRRSLLYIDDTPDSLLDEDAPTFSPQSVGRLVGGSLLLARPGLGGPAPGGGGTGVVGVVGGKEDKEEVRLMEWITGVLLSSLLSLPFSSFFFVVRILVPSSSSSSSSSSLNEYKGVHRKKYL